MGRPSLLNTRRSYTLLFVVFCVTSHSTTTTTYALLLLLLLFRLLHFYTTTPNSSAAACPNGSFPASQLDTKAHVNTSKNKGEMANAYSQEEEAAAVGLVANGIIEKKQVEK